MTWGRGSVTFFWQLAGPCSVFLKARYTSACPRANCIACTPLLPKPGGIGQHISSGPRTPSPLAVPITSGCTSRFSTGGRKTADIIGAAVALSHCPGTSGNSHQFRRSIDRFLRRSCSSGVRVLLSDRRFHKTRPLGAERSRGCGVRSRNVDHGGFDYRRAVNELFRGSPTPRRRCVPRLLRHRTKLRSRV